MRPVELRLRNFRSFFGDDFTFDFRDRHLVGVVGPIGSGKSSILDAIAFALYGRTPTVGRGTKALIHQRAEHAAVALRFDVDGELWEAQRMLRRKGAGDHALYRLADDTADAEKLEQVIGEAEVNERVAELLGLDFDAFGRSVLLAQGRFADFLMARPGERDKVLKGVFGLGRIDGMRAVAKERAREAEIEAEKATVSVQHLAELEAATAARKEGLAAGVERLTALEAVEPEVRTITAAIETATSEQQTAELYLKELRTLIEAFPDDDAVSTILSIARDAAERRVATAESLVQATDGLEAVEAQSKVAQITRSTLEGATALLAAGQEQQAAVSEADEALGRGKERLGQAVAEVAGQADRVALASRQAGLAADAVADRSAALAAAETGYHEAMHADMATSLRRRLHEGEPCPVCEQAVATVPTVSAEGADVGAALSALEAARRDRARAEETNTKASAALESAKTAHEDATRRSAEAEATAGELEQRQGQLRVVAAATTSELTTLVGSPDIEATVDAMRQEVAASAGAHDAAKTARENARADHDAAIESEQVSAKRLADLRVTLTGIAARIDDAPEIADDVDSIADGAATLRTMVDQSARDTTKRRDQAATIARDHAKELGHLMDDSGVTGSFDEALGGLRSRVEVHRDEITGAEQQLEGKADQIELRDAHVAAMKTYQALAGDLTDARFVRFLLDEERRSLAELGSEHFQRLSNGRYRFTEDGAFDIVDLTTAEAVRKADSLSGGETFLASLGLALALAEIVARGGGRLDAFFLDEGFGTLDLEHLDLAMEGIESLVGEDGNRLVVVVSHVPELRHRVEDLIELDRNPTTGDTRVLSG
ncbi:MAG: hypothetical protein BMS9Abin07_1865 [Acidimicrobiia bacterium]|nr:MAG: hypothetical protein BMS9Abin07_1865 [Acidimicrobiia bacterium]